MARLGDLFDKIEAKLAENMQSAGKPIPTFGRGMAAASAFKSLHSIAFVPIKGDGRKPRTAGGEPPALWERNLQVAARVYAKDLDACNELAERLVEAVEDSWGGDYQLEGEDWDTSSKIDSGLVLVLFFRFLVRFERLPLLDVVPTEMVVTPALVTEISP